MNAIDLLMQDHRTVERLFTDFLAADSADQQDELFQTLQNELLIHAEVEEKVFYPAVKAYAPEQVEKALKEHVEVKKMLADMLDRDLEDEHFDAQLSQLMESIQNHVQEEEGPEGAMELARENLDEDALDRMGSQIQMIKQRVQSDLAA